MRAHTSISNLLIAAGVALLSACAPFKLEPPDGFVEVHRYSSEARMKAQDNVGLSLRVFKNVRGGTLGYWAADLVEKLGLRGYTLVSQTPARSRNGVVGTRFDFDYTAQGSDAPKFYTAVLFVTDERKFVLQVAGDKAKEAAYKARIDEIVGELKVRGCKVASKICKGPQPPRLSTGGAPQIPAPAGGDEGVAPAGAK
ncbi:MAG: hypothetical protein KC420_03485, partial [Myxococcales bacterium]|nr:hypothetical protein [Myxococcales bacterium]